MTTEKKDPLSYEEFSEEYEVDEEADEVIRYFLQKRKGYALPEYRKARPETWSRLCRTLFCADDHFTVSHDFDADTMILLIDKYFQTRFWRGCDYSIFHFNSPGVKMRRMYEEAY